jgi:hypothetical protein
VLVDQVGDVVIVTVAQQLLGEPLSDRGGSKVVSFGKDLAGTINAVVKKHRRRSTNPSV